MAENLVYNNESRLNAATADSVIIKADAIAVIEGEQDVNVAKAEAVGIATVLGATDTIATIKAATDVAAVVTAVDGIESGWSQLGTIKNVEGEIPGTGEGTEEKGSISGTGESIVEGTDNDGNEGGDTPSISENGDEERDTP